MGVCLTAHAASRRLTSLPAQTVVSLCRFACNVRVQYLGRVYVSESKGGHHAAGAIQQAKVYLCAHAVELLEPPRMSWRGWWLWGGGCPAVVVVVVIVVVEWLGWLGWLWCGGCGTVIVEWWL